MIYGMVTAIALVFLPSSLGATGLTTPFGRVVMKNVSIGRTYNLRELVGMPFRIINTGQTAEEILVTPYRPGHKQKVEKGYERIPSPSWIKLTQTKFYLAPGQEGVADVIVTIPDDPKHLGKNYDARIWSRVKAKGRFIAAGISSKLLIRIAPTVLTEEQKKKVDEIKKNLNFSLMPFVLAIDKFPLGKKVSINKRYEQGFRIVNVNNVPLHVQVESIPRRMSYFPDEKGTEDGEAGWLKVRREKFKVHPNSIVEIQLVLEIPDSPKHRGKTFLFTIRAGIEDQPVPVHAFGKVLVETKKYE